MKMSPILQLAWVIFSGLGDVFAAELLAVKNKGTL